MIPTGVFQIPLVLQTFEQVADSLVSCNDQPTTGMHSAMMTTYSTPTNATPNSVYDVHFSKAHEPRLQRTTDTFISLQEVLPSPLPPRWHSSPMIWHSRKYLKVHGHDGRDIAASIAVVRRGPDGHHVLRRKVVLVALVDELMRACDEL